MRSPALCHNLRSDVSGLTMGNYKSLSDPVGEAAFANILGAQPGHCRLRTSDRGSACPGSPSA